MNQILVTKKLYITPELKRKKKIYKFDFFLSIFIICILISVVIYAEYDKNKDQETSQQILSEFNTETPQGQDTTVAKNNVLLVVIDEEQEETTEPIEQTNTENKEPTSSATATTSSTSKRTSTNLGVKTTRDGYQYKNIASIYIPKINVKYAITDGLTHSEAETEALLKNSPTKFWGPEPNKIGNFCIVGHNYRNGKFFSNVPKLVQGDIIEITDYTGKTKKYSVYDKYQVVPEDLSCTSQYTDGRKEITLITCTDDSKERVIVKARAL